MIYEYQLEMRVTIRKVEYDPGDTERKYPRWMNEALSVQESKQLGALNFAQVAHVLEAFYSVTEALSESFGPKP